MLECPICIEEEEENKPLINICQNNHKFHQDCINSWILSNKESCPSCRAPILKNVIISVCFQNIKNLTISACQQYLIYHSQNSSGIISFHGKSGKKKVRRLQILAEKSNSYEEVIDHIKSFFKNRMRNKQNQVISAAVNTNAHSFISFFLDRIKKNNFFYSQILFENQPIIINSSTMGGYPNSQTYRATDNINYFENYMALEMLKRILIDRIKKI